MRKPILILAGLLMTLTAQAQVPRAPVIRPMPPPSHQFTGPFCSQALPAGTPCVWVPLAPCTITTGEGQACAWTTTTGPAPSQCIDTYAVRRDDFGNLVDTRRIRVCVDSGGIPGYRGFGWEVFMVVAQDGGDPCGPEQDAGYFGSGNVQVECPQ